MLISIACILFMFLGSVSAVDLDSTIDDANLLGENNKVVFSSQILDVSSDDSISETISHDDEGFLQSQYISDDILANGTVATSLVGNDSEFYFNSGNSFKVSLSDVNGTPLTNQSVIFTINGNNYTRITNENGTASIKINLNSGSYDIASYYEGTSVYEPCNATNIIKVLSTISGDDIEKYYRNATQYYATFVNSQGALLNNTTVAFNINGVYYERKTNENGTARLNINLHSGDYVLTAINPVTGEMHSNDVTVLTTLYAADIVKYYKNDTQYYVSVLNATGNPLINESVTFNINGVYYNRTTDSSGIAKMNINLNPGNYTITTINPVNDEMHSNNIEVLPTIFADDLDMIYRNGSRFKAHVLDGNGNPLANSNVTFNINGIHYTRVSDAEGNAYLNINLDVGQYVITATNDKGLSVSNTINISKCNSTISGSNAHIIYGVDRDYTVTLMGLNNKSVRSATVYFSYAGRNVTALTNENGEATITISNISIGTYSIEYGFLGDINYYPCKSNSTFIVANSTVILSAEDLDMVYKDGSSFNVTLTDLDSNPLANETITFNLNGVDYNRTTDANGTARIKINLFPNSYKITYTHGEVDAEDYYQSSNIINVAKLVAIFYGEDLVMNGGETAPFIVRLADTNADPVKDMQVTFEINGVSYNRTTNASGVAKLNIGLNVGFYTITASIDNVVYAAEELSRHVLVNGSTLTSDGDVEVVAGNKFTYSAYLFDPYGNPRANAEVEFTYAGVTKTASTDSKGVASITIDGLAKGDYLIVYRYTGDNTAGEANIHVFGAIPIASLVSAANTVNLYIEKNAKLPSTVTIGDLTFTTAQYLYLLSEAIYNLNNGDKSNLYVFNVNNPTNPGAAANMGVLNKYVAVARSILDSMDSGTTPNSVDSELGKIGYDGIVYAFTRVMVYYGSMAKLPTSVAIKSLVIYTSQSVLDSKNTITNLEPYLNPSKNCQADNPTIVALAESLTKGLTTSVEKATAIFNYVRDTVSYSFYYDTKYGAVGTLNAKTGNCVDHSHLLIALFRAADLPARYVHGTCTFSSGSTYGHVWTQVLIGDTWVVADATSTRNSFGKVVNWNNYAYSLKGYYAAISF